jgi:DNA-binding CsgD family transcriptional regulator
VGEVSIDAFNEVLALSEEEHRVFLMLGEGLTFKEMAGREGHVKSVKTIQAHLESCKNKLTVSGFAPLRVFAARYAYHCELFGVQRIKIRKVEPKINYKFTSIPKP